MLKSKDISYNRYEIAQRVFFFAMGLVYLVAFLSLGLQIRGLVGAQGILPVESFLHWVQENYPGNPYWGVPTIFWLNASDWILQGACYLGILLALTFLWGRSNALISLLLWGLYLSLYSVGQVFLSFQWDILLLETGFLVIFLSPFSLKLKSINATPPATLILWLLRWLLFRLMFQSGLVKLLSGDSSWRDLTALTYHYETQPLPHWISYWVHQLPLWFHRVSAGIMFGMELIVPFGIFFPNPIRFWSAFLLIGLQIFIILTGNYGFFNLLTIALCLLLIADAYWPAWLRRWLQPQSLNKTSSRPWPRVVLVGLTVFIIFLSVPTLAVRLHPHGTLTTWFRRVQEVVGPFQWVNSYGLFASMTKRRPEILIEGSVDRRHWKVYELPYKPGDVTQRPKFLLGPMPRLDWQLWFAALRPPGRYPYWFENLLVRLLEGEPRVLALFENNPFPQQPPRYVRARVAPYYFSTPKVKEATGEWWIRGMERNYAPIYEKRGEKIYKQ